MPFFLLAALSIILALGGVLVGWAGLDDRSSGLLTGGAVAIGSAALLFGMALVLRELRASRTALIEALASRQAVAPAAPQPVPVEQPAPLAREPLQQPAPDSAADAALATFAAGLAEEANRRVESLRFPPPVKREGPPTILATAIAAGSADKQSASAKDEPVIPARAEPEKPVFAPAPPPVDEPPKVEELRPAATRPVLDPLRPGARREGESLLKPSFRFRPLAEPPVAPAPPPPPRIESEPAAPAADRPTEIAAEAAAPKPPDIDTILNEIIARRDRAQQARSEERPRSLGLGAPVEPLKAAVINERDEASAKTAPNRDEKPVEKAPTPVEAPKPVAPAPESADGESDKVEEVETIEVVAEEPATEEQPEIVEEPAVEAAESEPVEETVAEPVAEPVAKEVADEPAAATHEHHLHHAEPAAPEEASPVIELEPEPEPEAAPAPAAPLRKLVRSFSSGPNRYTMYDDGSIEAETPTGRLTFASFDELRRYIDERMNQRGTGT